MPVLPAPRPSCPRSLDPPQVLSSPVAFSTLGPSSSFTPFTPERGSWCRAIRRDSQQVCQRLGSAHTVSSSSSLQAATGGPAQGQGQHPLLPSVLTQQCLPKPAAGRRWLCRAFLVRVALCPRTSSHLVKFEFNPDVVGWCGGWVQPDLGSRGSGFKSQNGLLGECGPGWASNTTGPTRLPRAPSLP